MPPRWAVRAAALALSAALVLAGLAVLRRWPDTPRSVLAAALLAGIVGIAPLVYIHETPVLRTALLGAAVGGALLTVVELPAEIARPAAQAGHPFALVWMLRGALGIGCAILLGKILLLHRFSSCHRSKPRRNAEQEHQRLLPFQEQVYERLRTAIMDVPAEDSMHLIQLQARYGEGKSFLLDRLDALLNRQSTLAGDAGHLAVVNVNVWAQQTEPDLYLAVVEEIVGHWRYWYPYGWLRYPLPLFASHLAKESKLAIGAGQAGAQAQLELPLAVPRPTGQRALERLTARVRARGGRTVVVLDEVDRAAPAVAQAAATLALRSLNVPGLIVVLSYVDEAMRFKAFNPLTGGLEDLDSTMQALIFSGGPEQADGTAPGGPLHSGNEPAPDSLAQWQAFKSLNPDLALPPQPKESSLALALEPGPVDRPGAWPLHDVLRLGWAWASPARRRLLQDRVAQRYLATHPILFPPASTDDIAAMMVRFPSLRALVLKLTGKDPRDPAVAEALRTAVEAAFRGWRELPQHVPRMAAIRELEGEIVTRLSALERPGPQALSFEVTAFAVLVAYDAAALKLLEVSPNGAVI